MSAQLLLFDTHPIQYRSPVFRELCARLGQTEILFFNPQFDGGKWWFHEVGKIPKQNWNLPLMEGFPSQVLNLSQIPLRERYRKLKQTLGENKPRAVVIFGYYLPEHWMLRMLAKQLGIAIIFVGETFQNSHSAWRRPLQTRFRRIFFSGVDRFITIGKRNEAYYQSLGIADEKLFAAHYCVDNEFFHASPAEASRLRQQWRQQHAIPTDAFVNLFVARLFERKRPEDALGVQEILQKQKRFHTVFVGNGPMEASLRERAKRNKRVHFLGFQDQQATRAAYYGSDCLFLPSEFETWGLVANEASACGIPVVASDTCGVAGDLVVHGETGFVFQKADISGAALHLSKMCKEPELVSRLGRTAYQRVIRDYSVQQFAEAFLKAFQSLDAKP
jgi:glycosyltransferase involved in cell wall biosynthesis